MYRKEMQNKELKSKPICDLSTVIQSNSATVYYLGLDILTVRQLWSYYSIFIRYLFLQINLSLTSFYLLLLSKMANCGEKSF